MHGIHTVVKCLIPFTDQFSAKYLIQQVHQQIAQGEEDLARQSTGEIWLLNRAFEQLT